MKVGIISDTHGLFREELYGVLQGVDRIIHLGDIGGREVIDNLEKIAPTVAVLGNVDDDSLDFSRTETLEVEGVKIFMIHNINEKKSIPNDESIRIIVYGHSHWPDLKERDDIIYCNPGSIGRRRFKLPISYGIMSIDKEDINIKIYEFFNNQILFHERYSKINGR